MKDAELEGVHVDTEAAPPSPLHTRSEHLWHERGDGGVREMIDTG